MSSSSENRMVEAALISDHGSVVAGVASLIEQLVEQSSPLDKTRIAQLCKIKVIRQGGWIGTRPRGRKIRIAKLGNRTWIVDVRELKSAPKSTEQRSIDRATSFLKERLDIADDDLGWIKWGVRGRFPRECGTGDNLIQIWRSKDAKRPSAVIKAVPVLLKQPTKRWTRFYVPEPSGRSSEITWGQFRRLLRQISYSRQVKAGSVQLVEPDVADTISRKWNAAARN
jgi:hypothetical protein